MQRIVAVYAILVKNVFGACKMKKFRTFEVYNARGKWIDTVFFTDVDADYVRRSLITHDGYPEDIRVVERG